jgi:GGDEF domain-containing protein
MALHGVGATFYRSPDGQLIRRTVIALVTCPVRHADQAAAGNYAARAEIETANELAVLAAGFNDMSAAIESDTPSAGWKRPARQDRLEALAHQDGLTGLPNRRRFDDGLDKEWRRARREQQALAALMMDIDYFKGYNDHYGHGAGDECLKRVAAALAGALVRPGDLVARYGGEEFVALLPDTDLEGAPCREDRAAPSKPWRCPMKSQAAAGDRQHRLCQPVPGPKASWRNCSKPPTACCTRPSSGRNRLRRSRADRLPLRRAATLPQPSAPLAGDLIPEKGVLAITVCAIALVVCYCYR